MLLVLLCLAVLNAHSQSAPCTEHQCMAVVDAGSTGARLHIFTYDKDPNNTAVNIKELWSNKVKPGFATLEGKQSIIDDYLARLFAGALEYPMPVYFYSTAGMRLLPQNLQKIHYQIVQNWFKQHPQWQLIDAKTLTGNEEALYDWLSVNYHLGTLQAPNEPIGVMDIGGASVQIVFPLPEKVDSRKDSQVTLDLYGQHFNLFVHSFLGLGQNEMSHQLLDNSSCFPEGYPLPDGGMGQGDARNCADTLATLINQVHYVNDTVRPFLTTYPIHDWYLLGGVAYLAESKPFQFQNNQLTNQELLEQANSLICHQQWQNLSNEFPNNDYLDNYCILPAFYYALMVHGYGLSAQQSVHYISSAQNLDWTLGVVVYH
jgi:hypothetical protein